MDSQLVVEAIRVFVRFLQDYLFALIAIGILSMVLLEGVKKIFLLRQKYHLRAIKNWIGKDFLGKDNYHKLLSTHLEVNGNLKKHYNALDELLHLTTGSNFKELSYNYNPSLTKMIRNLFSADEKYAVFSLEISKMMGHVQIAVDSALDTPQKYPALYCFATSGANFSDVENWYLNSQKTEKEIIEEGHPSKERVDQFMTLQKLSKRKLDAFQLQKGFRWANLNQVIVLLIGSVMMFSILLWINGTSVLNFSIVGVYLLASLIGGIFSPIIKDLTSILGNFKDRG